MKSIIQKKKICYICNKNVLLEEHHCIFGNANRKKSEQDGLKVFLCQEHHRGRFGVHGKNGHELDMMLKKTAEKTWLEYYNKTIDDFIERYGRNYL